MSDVPVTPRSSDEIERVAEGWRRALDPDDLWAPDILEMIEKASREFRDTQGLNVIFRPDSEMGAEEARAESNPPLISVRESLRSRENRLRSTLAHELGHVLLHPGVPKFRKEVATGSPANLSVLQSAEAQAWVFARAFLMPSWKVAQATSALNLSLRCRVSLDIAEIRYNQYTRTAQKRVEPPGVRSLIKRLEAANAAPIDPKIARDRQRITAWERAPHIPGRDPSRFRRSADFDCGFTIDRTQYGNSLSQFGWYVQDGHALAYVALKKSE